MSEPKDDLVERDNHHNAATCPHCTDNGRFVLVEAELIDGLRGYAAHKVMCNAEGTWIISGVEEKLPCTCGLSTLLASIKEQ